MRIILFIMLLASMVWSDIFSLNRANVWVMASDASKSYAKSGWSKDAKIQNSSVLVNDAVVATGVPNSALVLVNDLKTSYPKPSSNTLSASLTSFDSAKGALGENLYTPYIEINPSSGIYDKTIAVTFKIVGQFNGSNFYYTINNTTYTVSLQGKKSFTIYLAKSGQYTIKCGFEMNNQPYQANYTLAIADKKADSDGDGVPDTVEAELGLNPFDSSMPDSNNNGWSDFDEFIRDNNITDSDGDGWSDFDEELRGTDKLDARICADKASIPAANSLYGVEYELQEANGIYSISSAKAVTLHSKIMYDSNKIIAQKGINLCLQSVDAYKNSLLNKSIPYMRVSGSENFIVRVAEKNNTKIYKKFYAKQLALTPAQFKKTAIFQNLPNEMNATVYKQAYINYLRQNLVRKVPNSVDINSTIDVAFLEAALKRYAQDKNQTINLGVAGVPKDALKKLYQALNKSNKTLTAFFNDIKVNMSTSYNDAYNIFINENNNTQKALTQFLQLNQNENFWYKLTLLTLFTQEELTNNLSLLDPNSDSDNDGVTNKNEVLAQMPSNPNNNDSDGDGIEDGDDICINDLTNSCNMNISYTQDSDSDGIDDAVDNCPYTPNPNQTATKDTRVGDACLNSVAIIQPKLNQTIYQFNSITFRAKSLVNQYYWSVNGIKKLSNSDTFVYTFSNEGNFTICIHDINSNNKSCRQIKVLKHTIQNDFIIQTTDIKEGDSQVTNSFVLIKYQKPLQQDNTLQIQTIDGTAKAGSDYKAINTQITLHKNEQSKLIALEVLGDTQIEGNEYFTLKVGNKEKNITIIDDDQALTVLTLKIEEATQIDNNITLIEGNQSRNVTLTFKLNQVVNRDVSFHYTFSADANYPANTVEFTQSGDITIHSGEREANVTLGINGDVFDDYDKYYTIKLSNANGVTFAYSQYHLIVKDDDPMPILSLRTRVNSLKEGEHIKVEIWIDKDSYKNIIGSFKFDGNATKGSDFIVSNENFLIPTTTPLNDSAHSAFIIDLNATKDSVKEGAENILISLKNITNARWDGNQTTLMLQDAIKPLYFAFNDGIHGVEPWIRDEENNQTFMLKDIKPQGDSNPLQFIEVGSKVYFVAQNNQGLALYESDGTSANTKKVYDFNVTEEEIYRLINLDNNLYITLFENIQNNPKMKLYKYINNNLVTIGQIAQDINEQPEFATFEHKLFIIYSNINGATIINKYDSLTNQITQVDMLANTSGYLAPVVCNNKLFVVVNQNSDLRQINDNNTTFLSATATGNFEDVVCENNKLYLLAQDSVSSSITFMYWDEVNRNLVAPIIVENAIYYPPLMHSNGNIYWAVTDTINNNTKLYKYNTAIGDIEQIYTLSFAPFGLIAAENGVYYFDFTHLGYLDREIDSWQNADLIPVGVIDNTLFYILKDANSGVDSLYKHNGSKKTLLK